MPQVIPAIVSSLQAIGFASVTAAGVKSFLLQTVASMALSAAASALAPKPDMSAQGGGITTNVTTAGSANPRSFVLGRYATAGFALAAPYTFAINDNDNKYLTYIIDISDAPITGIDTYYVDGKPYTVVADDSELGDKLSGELNGHAWVRFHDGNQTQADTMLQTAFHDCKDRPINNTFIMSGVAYSVMTFKYDNDDPKYAGQPQVKFQVRGMKLYDPRKDSSIGGNGSHRWGQPNTYEFTTNPIVMIYNILRGITLAPGHVWGLNVKANSLPLNFWFAAANVCDQAGNDPNADAWYGDKKRYQAGIEVGVDQQPLSVIEELLKSCSGSICEYGGQYIVTAGSPEVPVAHINDDIILADQPLEYQVSQGLANRYNGIIAGYPDPRKLWEENDAVPLFRPDLEAQDGGRRLVATAKFPAVPYPSQVRRLMRESVADYRRQRQHSIVLPPSYLNLKPTQCITWTSPTNGYDSKLFMVVAKTVDPQTLQVAVALKERNPADYDFDAVFDGRHPTVPAITENLNIRVGVLGFTAIPFMIESAGVAKKAAVKMTWQTGLSFKRLKFQIRLTESQTVIKSGTTETIDGVQIVSDGILSNTAYQVRSIAVARHAQWGEWTDVVSGQDMTDLGAIDQALLDDVQEFKDWMNDGYEQAVIDSVNELRQEINDDISGIQGDVANNVRNQLASNTNWLSSEILSAVGVSKDYTDAGILSERTERNTLAESINGRIDQLTAALTSDQLLVNNDFATSTGNDFDAWDEIGTIVKVSKNTASTDTLVANMPADTSVQLAAGGANAIRQTFDLGQYTAQDKLQFKFRAGALGSGSRSVEVTIRWFNASGAVLSPQYQMTHTFNAGESFRRMVADRADIPVNSRTAELTIRHASTSGNPILLTKAEATMVNAAIEAQVSELQAAHVTMNAALVTLTTNVNARFESMAGSITDNIAVLSSNIGTIANRVATVEARSANNAANITTLKTSIANTNAVIALVENRMSAKFGLAEKIKDGVFANGLNDWAGTITPTPGIGAKNVASSSWPVSKSPANNFIVLNAGMTGIITTDSFPVTGGEVFDAEFSHARSPNGVVPRLHYRFRRADGTFTPSPNIINGSNIYGEGSGKWLTERHNGIIAPDDAVTGEVLLTARDATGPNPCWITNISFKRKGAFEAQVSSELDEIRLVSSNTIASIAAVEQRLTANFNGLANTVSAHSTALSNVYTKAQANAAIAAQIAAYGVTVDNKLGQRALANTVSALTTRVNNAEGNLSSQSQSLTTLDNRITGVDNEKGRTIYQTTAPTGTWRDYRNTWVNTTNGENIPHRWNGSAWIRASDQSVVDDAVAKSNTEARAFATNLVTTQVNALKNGELKSQAQSLTSIKADVDRVSAGGKIRMAAMATPSGAQGRVGIVAEASDGATSHQAGIQMVAESNGRTSVRIVAQDFFIVDDYATVPTEAIPFRVMDGGVRMHGAFIGNLTVGTLKVQDNAISSIESSYTSGSISGDILNFEIQRLTINKGRSDAVPIFWKVSFADQAQIILQRRIGSGSFENLEVFGSGHYYDTVQSGTTYWSVDTWGGTGTVTYRLLGTRYYTRNVGGSNGNEVTYSAAGPFSRRLLGALNILK